MSKTVSLPLPTEVAQAQSDRLFSTIVRAVEAAGGWMPFERYMELALYAPGLGYYSGGAAKFGRRVEDGGDFITAPELTPSSAAPSRTRSRRSCGRCRPASATWWNSAQAPASSRPTS